MSTSVAERPAATAAPEGESRSGSAIYEGSVSHRRSDPVEHAFHYRIFMPLLDLEELPDLLDDVPLWSARRRAPARVRRRDHLGDPAVPLADAARNLVEDRTGRRPAGTVKLLANPRYWGVGFNPVAFYFLYGREPTAGVEAMIAEVTNTPWGESRTYVLEAGEEGLSGEFDKRLHVSPFMPMEQNYEWSASEPGDRLGVSIRNREQGRIVFEAGLALKRRQLSPRALTGLLFRYPPMTASTLVRIYAHALALKLKGVPYFSHPPEDAR